MTRQTVCLVLAGLVLSACLSTGRTDPRPLSPTMFVDQVFPVLRQHCLGCHGPFYQLSGLSLDTAEGIRRGGKSGPVIEPGDPASSELFRRISLPEEHDDRMPQKAKRLSAEEIETIRSWIASGADLGDEAG